MQYIPNETQVTIVKDGIQKVIETPEILQNKLYITSHGVYFRSLEEYMNLLSREQVKYILYEIKNEQVRRVVYDMQLFDLFLVIEGELCGMCADLIYMLEGNQFKPIGGIQLTKDQFYQVLKEDWSFLKMSLLHPPKHNMFEYKSNGLTFTYIQNYVFTFDGQKITRNNFKFDLTNLTQKYVQLNDTIYGFAGLYQNTKQFVQLNGSKCKIMFSTPDFQYESSDLVIENGHVLVKQKIYSDYEDSVNKLGQFVQVPKQFCEVVFENNVFQRFQGELPTPLHVIDGVDFYCQHAVWKGKAVQLPLLLKKGVEVKRIQNEQINIEGYNLEVGELKTIVG